ncbi:MAG: aldo/keto reductase [Gammaproteobacteria bacterium]|jgi:diketogulonate reductase-like aldo/keto reductase|nr:aldo/keto reductase [Gammaproteobacteria bacterium]
MSIRYSRRNALKLFGAGAAGAWLAPGLSLAAGGEMLRKPIPGGDQLPVIGMGTWQTFNVGSDPELLDARTEVVRAFFEHGGGLVDSSPMYGSAPDVMGYALGKLGVPDALFAAEKVWSPAGGSTREQVASLGERWGIDRFELMQVHNLSDWRQHLDNLQQMKADGEIGHVGITTSHGRRHETMAQIMREHDIDFVQLTYNITHRQVEQRLLPLAREKGIAVIANRPFDGGRLIKGIQRRHDVPAWAREEFGCRNWADFLLKFIVSHPALTCAIPATTRVEHVIENMRAGRTPMPDAQTRERMARHVESL